MLSFIVFALAFAASSALTIVPLSSADANGAAYRVNTTSRIYIVSNSPQDVLQRITIKTDLGSNANAYTLSVPQADGSLTPLIPSQNSDLLSVEVTGTNDATGWLYIDSITPNLNVFPILENSSISFKQGTNVFFKMSSPAGKIPVAQNVVIGKNQVLNGFVGLPDSKDMVQFFDSDSIEGLTNYDQLELPMDMFHFTSNSADIKYEITYAARKGITIGSSGLLMTDSFPTGTFGTNDYDLNNSKGVNVDSIFIPRVDKTHVYAGNITVFMTPATQDPTVFPMFSNADANYTSNSPMSRIVVEADGPYSIQYFLRDTSITSPSPVESTTKTSSIPQIIASLLVAAVLRF